MDITLLDQNIGYAMRSLNIDSAGQIVAIFTVGTVAEDGDYKQLAEKNFVLAPEDAAGVLNTASVAEGTVYAALTAALVANLSQRSDWFV